jgi:RNA polymerase primary sigma factor
LIIHPVEKIIVTKPYKPKIMSMRQLKISQSITNRDALSLEKYLQEIGKIYMISPEEEIRLSRLIRKGDKTALDKLTKANLRFVVSVAKQYQGHGLPLSDLINEGNMGLIKAAKKFDDTRGFKFISFAVWWIRQSIQHALADNARLIRLPLNRVALAGRIRKTQSVLEQQLERQPSIEELAEAMSMGIDEVADSVGHIDRHISLDAPSAADEESNLLDELENMDAMKANNKLTYTDSLHTEILRTLKTLPDKQRETLCYFFGIGFDHSFSLDDIARKFEVTTERVRQIKDKAISNLRSDQNFNLLRGFLGN